MQYCILFTQDIASGFRIVGPFDNFEDALAYGEGLQGDYYWWVIELETPDD